MWDIFLQGGILSTSRDVLYSKAATSKNLESSQGDENIQTTRSRHWHPCPRYFFNKFACLHRSIITIRVWLTRSWFSLYTCDFHECEMEDVIVGKVGGQYITVHNNMAWTTLVNKFIEILWWKWSMWWSPQKLQQMRVWFNTIWLVRQGCIIEVQGYLQYKLFGNFRTKEPLVLGFWKLSESNNIQLYLKLSKNQWFSRRNWAL
jgi:hypothetical protein